MLTVRLILHHRDGRVEESSLMGEGPFMFDGVIHLPPHADHWWRVSSLRWNGDGKSGVAELEPTERPPELQTLSM
jgi:hypothetical protein